MTAPPGIACAAALLTASAGWCGDLEAGKRAYENGDYAAAHRSLLLAARSGNAEAQEFMGLMYAFGSELYPGVPRNEVASRQWLDRAARSGRPAARYLYCGVARSAGVRAATAFYCFDRIAEPAR